MLQCGASSPRRREVIRYPEITKNPLTPNSAMAPSGARTFGKLRVPETWAARTKKIDIARKPSRLGTVLWLPNPRLRRYTIARSHIVETSSDYRIQRIGRLN